MVSQFLRTLSRGWSGVEKAHLELTEVCLFVGFSEILQVLVQSVIDSTALVQVKEGTLLRRRHLEHIIRDGRGQTRPYILNPSHFLRLLLLLLLVERNRGWALQRTQVILLLHGRCEICMLSKSVLATSELPSDIESSL